MTGVPQRIVGWLRSHRTFRFVAAAVAVSLPVINWVLNAVGQAQTALSLLGHTWKVITHPFFPLAVIGLLFGLSYWPILIRLRRKPSFAIRPICGDTLTRQQTDGVTARLAIRNVSGCTLNGCSVRLMDAFPLHFGYVMNDPHCYPSVHSHRGESFLLRWSDHSAIDGKFLDIPSDDAERIAEVIVLSAGRPLFAAADGNDLDGKMEGIGFGRWVKLGIKVAAANGEFDDFELVAACSDHDPGPIMLDHWQPRGEEILKTQKAKERTPNEVPQSSTSSQ